MNGIFGRAAESAIILSGLLDGAVSFVVTGRPGIGKSALARQIQTELQATVGEGQNSPAEIIIVDDIHLLSEPELQHLTDQIDLGKQKYLLLGRELPQQFSAIVEAAVLEHIELQALARASAEELISALAGTVGVSIRIRDQLMKYSGKVPAVLVELTGAIIRVAKLEGEKHATWDDTVIANTPVVQEILQTWFHVRSNGEKIEPHFSNPQDRHLLEQVALAEQLPLGLFERLGRGDTGQLGVSADSPDDSTDFDKYFESILKVETSSFNVLYVSIADPLVALAIRGAIPMRQRRNHFRHLYQTAAKYFHEHWSRQLKNQAIIWARSAGEKVPWEWLEEIVRTRELTDNLHHDVEICSAIIEHPEASDHDRALGYMLRAQRSRFTESSAAAVSDLDMALQEFGKQPIEHDVNLLLKIAFIASDIEQYSMDHIVDSVERLQLSEHAFKELHDKKALRSVRIRKASHVAYSGNFQESSQFFQKAVDEYQVADLIPMTTPYIVVLTQQGRYAEAIQFGNRAYLASLLRGFKGARRSAEITSAIYLCHIIAGDLNAALKLHYSDGLLQHQKEFLGQYDPALVELSEGLALLHQGLWTKARVVIEATLALFKLQDPSGFEPFGLAMFALAHATSGDRTKVKELLALMSHTPSRSSRIVEGAIGVYKVQALLWIRDPSAVEEAAQLIAWARERELHLIELEAQHLHMMAAGKFLRTEAEHIHELAARVDAPVAPLLADYADEMSREKMLAPFGKSARLLARQGYWIPMQLDIVELTSRETEIAVLAGVGFSRRVIGEKLSISKRTVDSHLTRIFEKLHLTKWEELADMLENLQ